MKKISSLFLVLLSITLSVSAQTNTTLQTKLAGYVCALQSKNPYNPAKKYSVTLNLHGKGESAWTEATSTVPSTFVGFSRLFGNGLQKEIRDNKFLLDDTTLVFTPQNGWGGFEVDKGKLFLDSILKGYNVDTNRINIICYSAGGAAANGILFSTSADYLKKVSSFFMISPVLSTSTTNATWEKTAQVPVWLVSCPTEGIYNDNCRSISTAINAVVPGLCEWTNIANVGHCGSFITPLTTLKNAAGQLYEQYRISKWKKPAVVVVPNKSPVIDSVSFNASIRMPSQVFFISIKATDPEALPLKYSYAVISGPSTNVSFASLTSLATATFMVPGTYVIRCTVTDASGATAFKDITLSLLPARVVYKTLYEAACDTSPAVLLSIYTDGTWEETIQ